MNRLGTVELVEMVVTDRCPSHRQWRCQYEHDYCTQCVSRKQTCKNL